MIAKSMADVSNAETYQGFCEKRMLSYVCVGSPHKKQYGGSDFDSASEIDNSISVKTILYMAIVLS
ncbi:MAG TPA: hypothetical protein PLX97_01520, partial [Gemmatales bacterium]|nr:hypothetical protein [Gemmatales bacterium]